MTAQSMNSGRFPVMGALQRRRLLMWLMLSVLAALLGYFGFRGYLSPELLFHFANSLYC
jgi:quinol-cytochrome oxidoreductase complex cytochrome b subunit